MDLGQDRAVTMGCGIVTTGRTRASHWCGQREVRGTEFGEALLHTGDGPTPEVPAVDLVAAGGGSGA